MRMEIFREAIRDRFILSVRYKGETRTVEPHAVGMNSKDELIARCWQISSSNFLSEPGFRLFFLDQIESASATGKRFSGARPSYMRDDKAMQHIYAQL